LEEKRQINIQYKRLSIQRKAGKEINIRLYIIEKVLLTNAIKLKLPVSIRIYPVVNVIRIVRDRELVKG